MEERMSPKDPAESVLDWLGRVEVRAAVAHDRMTVFPVFGQADVALDYRTLAEAVAQGWAEVTERPAATIPELLLSNKGKEMILVLDGEEIVGGRQNRIVNASFLIAPGTQVTLPVTCVEHGRWHEVSRQFDVGEASYYHLRAAKAEQVHMNLRATGRPQADQGAIWSELADRHAAAETRSPTGAMHDLYSNRSDALAAYEQNLPHAEGACGLVVAMNGQVAGADLFDQPRTAAQLWPRLVRSYALDALEGEGGPPVEREQAVHLLARGRDARCQVYPSLGLGDDVRLEGNGVVGTGLVYQGVPVHVSLFRVERGRRDRGGTSMARASLRRSLRDPGRHLV